MTSTIAEPDWDTRTDQFLDRQDRERRELSLQEAIDDAIEDAECCMPACQALAVARAILFPCAHQGGYCARHRLGAMRRYHFVLKASGKPVPCGVCKTPITFVHWERIK